MNKGQLKAAFAKGARIQAWHLLPGATNSNQGQWDTLWPTDEPEFGCEAHLYRVHPEDISLIAELGQEVGAVAQVLEIRKADEEDAWFGRVEFTEPLKVGALLYPAHTSEARDAELIRALRNQYVSERTFRFQCENGMDYENARAHAESAVNQFEASFIAARERHAAMRQEGGSDA